MKIINADAFMAEINSAIDNMTKIGITVDGEWLWEKLNDALDNAPAIEPEQKTCEGCMWEDAYGYGSCPNCSRAYREDLYLPMT